MTKRPHHAGLPQRAPIQSASHHLTTHGTSKSGASATAGTFRLHSGQQFLSQTLNGHYIGLEEVQDGIWNILYYDTLLGRFDQRNKAITGAPSLRGKC